MMKISRYNLVYPMNSYSDQTLASSFLTRSTQLTLRNQYAEISSHYSAQYYQECLVNCKIQFKLRY